MKSAIIILLFIFLGSCHQPWVNVSDVNGKKHKVSYSDVHDDKEAKLDEAAFRYQYTKEARDKYKGVITSGTVENLTYIQFDSARIFLWPDCKEYAAIFTGGLLSAQMIYCKVTADCQPPQNFISTKYKTDVSEKENLYGWYGHTIRIEKFEYLSHLKTPSDKRRFKFWVYPFKTRWNGSNNIFYLELTNEEASDDTPMEDFIKDAKVTAFMYSRSVI